MRISAAAFACMTAVILLELTRGPYNWSETFGAVFYGLVAGSFVLGLLGAARAIGARDRPRRRRVLELAISAPPILLTIALGILVTVFVVGHAGD